VILTLNKV